MIINSLLDTDFYKFTMAQAVFHQFPGTQVEYTFKNRGRERLGLYYQEIADEISHLDTLRFTVSELNYLSTIPYLTSDFIDFLGMLQLNAYKYIYITVDDNNDLILKFKGPWIYTIWFEVPVLAIISEVFNRHHKQTDYPSKATIDKYEIAEKYNFTFSDFGTRRRHSLTRQEAVVDYLWKSKAILHSQRSSAYFVGTSNVRLAKRFFLTPIGTMAHEWLMAGQALGVRVVDSQKYMLENWVKEYRGSLGIALTDTIGIDAFLKDFDLYFAKLYDGVRQDSGNPYIFGNKIIEHYKKLRIDPMTKTIVFSDGLDFSMIPLIESYFKGKIKTSYGVGTNLTNDPHYGYPLKIVMKMTECNGQPVAKLSDTPGKGMCKDQEYVNYVKKVFSVT